MYEQIYESASLNLYFNNDTAIIKMEWTDASEGLDAEGFKTEMLNYINHATDKNAKAVLTDARHYAFPITPDVQEYIVENILTRYDEIGMKKQAFVVSSDFIAQLSIEQTISDGEASNLKFKTAYFETEKQATDWILYDKIANKANANSNGN
ncbi:MAG: hypothetical protein JJT94_14735 [Bernardetiaceae bacterium]|nr:hypothetical protein [Bernardetiaceae bacterium]